MEKGDKAIDVLVRRGIKNQDFCLLLTDDGIVLVREKSRDEVRPGAFGYSSVHLRDHNHPSAENVDKVAHDGNNLVIPYERLKKVSFRRGFSSCTMRREYMILLNYLDASQKVRRLSAVLSTPQPPSGRGSGNRTAASKNAMEVKGILAEVSAISGVFVADV